MHHKDTTWNQHGGVGATLLDNWVEERAVGAVRILKERDVRYISERGHADILIQDRNEDPREKFRTVCKAAYQPPPLISSRHPKQSQRKTMKERKWSEHEFQIPSVISPPTSSMYQSTAHAAYHRPDFHPTIPHPDDFMNVQEHPITFWSHLHHDGAHTVYGSTPKGNGDGPYIQRFGKHVEFSTPIEENLSNSQKN
ncbi:hypothetical protein HMI55_001830 [Coelomomyces lativittatus]|nr:hypothetical protein HMI55_001830 [Coelomomyces lativittatus]KAJ1513256.1 hypothetical protein HMI56_002780 [Coelomomyces lativittatus]